jgi:thiazole/oxazole-forming peptide maturase SagD family component
MQYVWNPEYDIFCLKNQVDFVAIDHEVSLEGSMIKNAVSMLIDMFSWTKDGCTFPDALETLATFNEQHVHELWQTLLQEGLLKDQESVAMLPVNYWIKNAGTHLFEHLPLEESDNPCSQLGFRFGGLYFLATSNKKISAFYFAKQIIEWAFSGKWLDRARPLFWQMDERILVGREFVPEHVRQWLKCTLETLLASKESGYLYEIDLRSFQIKREPVGEASSVVGILAPVIRQDDVTNSEQIKEFTPSFSIVLSRYRQPDVWQGNRQHLTCGGHPNPWIARRISAAEAIERSAAATYEVSKLSLGELRDDSRRIDPRHFIDLTPEQLNDSNLSSFDPQQSYHWCDAIEIVSGREAQIVADLCYFPFHTSKYERHLAWGNSSGMAAGQTIKEAQQSAFFELVERDAFMITWMTKRSAPRIPNLRIPFNIKQTQCQLKSIGYETALIDITVRGVPTVLSVAYRDQWPALVLGAAARNTLLEAVNAAWKEVEVGVYCRLLDPRMAENDKPCLQPKEVLTADDHAQFYNDPDHLNHAAFLWGSEEESERTLEEPYFKDFTESNIVSLCRRMALDQLYLVNYGNVCGFEVVRLLTPHLVPLTFGYNQLPRQQVIKSDLPGLYTGMLPDVFPVHPFD